MRNILIAAVILLAAPGVMAAAQPGQAYTEKNCFSIAIPAGWQKSPEVLGLSGPEEKVYGLEIAAPFSAELPVKIGVHYYAPGNLLHKTYEKFIKLHSRPPLGVNLDGKVYGKVQDGRAGSYYAKIFERKVFEYFLKRSLHPKKIYVYEKFAVVPAKSGFFVLRYYAPMSQAKVGLAAYEATLASFKPLAR